jgi:hypothetical protein
MAPRTVSGLAQGMAHDGHIRRKNYEFIGAKGLAPMSTFSRGPDLHPRDLDPTAHGGHTLRTALRGCILEFTYLEGLAPSIITGRGHVSCPGNQRSMARNELTRGMASTGHILLGNHTVNHTKGPVPMSAFTCSPDLHPRGLDPMIYGGYTLKNLLGGCISEFTNMGGLAPSLTAGHSQDFHLGNQRPMAHGELAQGMAQVATPS